MPSLRIIYDVERWAYHHRAVALKKFAPSDFDVSIAPLSCAEPPGMSPHGMNERVGINRALDEIPQDLVLFLPQSHISQAREELDRRRWGTKLISSWNNGWPNWIDIFHAVYRASDAMIINNTAYWKMTGQLPGTCVLRNGVDLDLFNITSPIKTREPRVLWLGSTMARRRKGYDQLLFPLETALTSAAIDCDFRLVDSVRGPKWSAAEMAAWYNTGTVLVCASHSEGTPNTALEAAACGCTVVSTPVGNMPELIRPGLNGYLVEPTLNSLLHGVQSAVENYEHLALQMREDIQPWAWARRSAEFFDVFRKIADSDSPKQRRYSMAPRPDYSKNLTVFVSTIGAPSYEDCLSGLEQQDCTFQLKVIDHVAPMSTAFQRMLDYCSTPFYVQVDEDMLLHPHAVRTLYNCMVNTPNDVAIVKGPLYDPYLDLCLSGVKIYRHGIVRGFPYANVESCEKNQARRLIDKGFRILNDPPELATSRPEDALGLHGTQWTAASIYERYMTLERKLRRNPEYRGGYGDLGQKFLERFLEHQGELEFFAFMGFVAGRHTSLEGGGKEKDYRTYNDLPGYQDARRLYRSLIREADIEN